MFRPVVLIRKTQFVGEGNVCVSKDDWSSNLNHRNTMRVEHRQQPQKEVGHPK